MVLLEHASQTTVLRSQFGAFWSALDTQGVRHEDQMQLNRKLRHHGREHDVHRPLGPLRTLRVSHPVHVHGEFEDSGNQGRNEHMEKRHRCGARRKEPQRKRQAATDTCASVTHPSVLLRTGEQSERMNV